LSDPLVQDIPTVADVAKLADDAVADIRSAATLDAVEATRIKYSGRNGTVTGLSRSIGKVPADQKKTFGAAVNDAKSRVETALDDRKAALLATSSPIVSTRKYDVTLPGDRVAPGRHHPLTQTMEELKSVLASMGFRYDDYPEIETEAFNFDALNTPGWHPSRDMHDSFYTKSGHVMRTHTSAFQTRAMKMIGNPPIRAMTSGRCYRRDEIDATHYPIFHQLDTICIDRNISLADLKWTLRTALRAILGDGVEIRFRPSYFPFTTPSAEVDVFYRGRWMELLGSGMIRPEVLRNGGIDPEQYQGFAFGIGIDRLTMARFGIDDIRLLYANEEGFLAQF
jgi:phenylalanyl-tRNA synthetase alpha chain